MTEGAKERPEGATKWPTDEQLRILGEAHDGERCAKLPYCLDCFFLQERDDLRAQLQTLRGEHERLNDSRNYWEDMWGAVERQAQQLAKERDTLEARERALRATCEEIADLASGWDEDGALRPREPLSWESVARMAMDYARAALAPRPRHDP